jgi:hypothetical protein
MPEDVRGGEGAEPGHGQASCRTPPVAVQPDGETGEPAPGQHETAERT